eukprot:maker-scaffold_93-snap-gene-0.31-mRNA-1 protein AED:0.01 eAED:0.01 QI:85/1/1/1/0/0/2/368/219
MGDSSHDLKQCKKIVKDLLSKPELEAFYFPVDWKGLGIEDYPDIVKHPMDLTTVKTKLENNEYITVLDYYKDLKLIWTNCMLYNPKSSGIYKLARNTQKILEKEMKPLLKKGIKRKSTGGEKKRKSKPSLDDKARVCRMFYCLDEIEVGKVVEWLDVETKEEGVLGKKWEQIKIGDEVEHEEALDINIDLISLDEFKKLEVFIKNMLVERVKASVSDSA